MFLKLVDDVRAAMPGLGFGEISVEDGLVSAVSQSNFGDGAANRVAFVPAEELAFLPAPTQLGDVDIGDGTFARQLANLEYAFDVHVCGFDSDSPDRFLAHQRRCLDIFEAVVEVVHSDSYGLYVWSAGKWSLERKDGVFGAELVVHLTVNIPLFDKRSAAATPRGIPGAPKPVTET